MPQVRPGPRRRRSSASKRQPSPHSGGDAKRQVTTADVVNLYLARIKAYNGTCVNQPQGLLGPVSTIAHAGQLNAFSTLNLRPASRQSWGFDDRHARSMTDAADTDPSMPDALETPPLDREFARTGKTRRSAARRRRGDQGSVRHVRHAHDQSGADIAYANDRPPTMRQSSHACGPPAPSSSRKPTRSDTRAATQPVWRRRLQSLRHRAHTDAARAPVRRVGGGRESRHMRHRRGDGHVDRAVPAAYDNVVGLAPTQELVSRAGMNGRAA